MQTSSRASASRGASPPGPTERVCPVKQSFVSKVTTSPGSSAAPARGPPNTHTTSSRDRRWPSRDRQRKTSPRRSNTSAAWDTATVACSHRWRMLRGTHCGRVRARSRQASAPAEALLDRLPRPVEGLCDLRPRSTLRTSLLDRSAFDLLQDVLHLRERVEDHERLVARPDAEHRPSVATRISSGILSINQGWSKPSPDGGFMARSYSSKRT